MINLHKIDKNKFAKILLANLKVAQNATSFNMLQLLLENKLAPYRKADDNEKLDVIKNFISEYRNQIADNIFIDPSFFNLNDDWKSDAYAQITGQGTLSGGVSPEIYFDRFLDATSNNILKGETLQKSIEYLIKGKKEKEKFTQPSEPISDERGGLGSVEQPDITEDKNFFVEALLQQLENKNIEISDEDRDILSSGTKDNEYYKTLLLTLQKIAADELNPHLSANISYLDSLLDKIDLDDPNSSADFEEKFNNLIIEYRSTQQHKYEMKPQEFFEQIKEDLKRINIIAKSLKQHILEQKFYRLKPILREDISGTEDLGIEDSEYLKKLEREYKKVLFHAMILLKALDKFVTKPEGGRAISLPAPQEGQGTRRRPQIQELDLFKQYVKILIDTIDEVNEDLEVFRSNLRLLSEKQFGQETFSADFLSTNLLDYSFLKTYASFLDQNLSSLNEDQLKSLTLSDQLVSSFMQSLGDNLLVPRFEFLKPYFKSEEIHPEALGETKQMVIDELKKMAKNAIQKQIASFSDPMMQTPIKGSKLQPGMEWYPKTPAEMEDWRSREKKRIKRETDDSKKDQTTASTLNYLIKKYASKNHS